MLRIDIKLDDQITPLLKKQKAAIKRFPDEALDEFQALTPRRTGNARANTELRGRDRILANYPYAERLDDGYSKQAPRGMSIPFEKWVQQWTRKVFGGK